MQARNTRASAFKRPGSREIRHSRTTLHKCGTWTPKGRTPLGDRCYDEEQCSHDRKCSGNHFEVRHGLGERRGVESDVRRNGHHGTLHVCTSASQHWIAARCRHSTCGARLFTKESINGADTIVPKTMEMAIRSGFIPNYGDTTASKSTQIFSTCGRLCEVSYLQTVREDPRSGRNDAVQKTGGREIGVSGGEHIKLRGIQCTCQNAAGSSSSSTVPQ